MIELISLATILVVHEASHAIAAELLYGRGSVARFSLGLPPVWRSVRIGSLELALGKLPIGASTGILPAPYHRAGRARRIAVSLAGIATNLATWALFPGTPLGDLSLILGVANLLPIPTMDGGHVLLELLGIEGERRRRWERRGLRIALIGSIAIVVASGLFYLAVTR